MSYESKMLEELAMPSRKEVENALLRSLLKHDGIPHSSMGRDDVCNGIAFCHLHHWAFDVGWFTVLDNYKIQVSPQIDCLPTGCGKIADYEFFRALGTQRDKLGLPSRNEIFPHHNAIRWHRENIFHEQCI